MSKVPIPLYESKLLGSNNKYKFGAYLHTFDLCTGILFIGDLKEYNRQICGAYNLSFGKYCETK